MVYNRGSRFLLDGRNNQTSYRFSETEAEYQDFVVGDRASETNGSKNTWGYFIGNYQVVVTKAIEYPLSPGERAPRKPAKSRLITGIFCDRKR